MGTLDAMSRRLDKLETAAETKAKGSGWYVVASDAWEALQEEERDRIEAAHALVLLVDPSIRDPRDPLPEGTP